MAYVLGIDGGGTKTVALAADVRGNVLGRGTSGASNYQTVGLGHAVAALKEASERAAADAGITTHRFEVACLGLAGVGRETDRALLLPTIKKLELVDRIILEHDAAIALAGATACQPGIVVLAGTGAMAFGMNRSGKKRRSGGWGNVLGDEGSAYYIGRRALAAACRAYDGRGPGTALVSKLMEDLSLDHFTDIVSKIYHKEASPLCSKELSPDGILEKTGRPESRKAGGEHDVPYSPRPSGLLAFSSSLAPLVSQLARTGDEVATGILKDAAEELALAANAVIRGLGMEDEEFHVAASGSVFRAGDSLMIPFAESVKSTAPRAEIVPPRFEPAIGAVFLALQEAGIELSDEVLSRVMNTNNV